MSGKVCCSDDRFREFVETVPDACVVLDQRGRIVLLNAQAEELFGYSRDQLVGAPVSLLIPERLHARTALPGLAGWADSHAGQRRALGIVGLRSTRSEFPAEVSLRAFESDLGPGFAVAIRDVTHQEQARETLLQHLSDLAHVTRLSTMGEMAAGLAHELNQPLYAIANYARACQELVREPDKSAARLTETCDKLMAQAHRAAEIVRRLRRFIARREPRRAPVDLNALVREVQQLMLFHSHRFAITLMIELAAGLPRVSGDVILLEQVLVNLVRNSFEALSEAHTANPAVIVRTARGDAGLVEIVVSDNGPGFKTTSMDQLFESYYTTKEQGMGLGLPISRSIAEAHGGRLTASAPEAGGAVFCLSLPAEEAVNVS